MATLIASNPTIVDVGNMPENADYKDMIDLMSQINPILQDALALPANKGMSHLTTVRTGLPSVTWGRLYKGVPTTKGTRQQVTDTMGFVESAAEVDARLVDDFEEAMDKASIRFDESQGHMEAMSQEVATAIFYHDTNVDPAKPMGLAPRFNDLTNAENKVQIINGGGVGSDNTSVWFITWDRNAVHLIYPKGTAAGLKKTDGGRIHVSDEAGNRYWVYRDDFKWHIGITVRDWRYVVRICNIDISDLTQDAATGADLIELMTKAYYAHQGRRTSKGKTYIYAATVIVMFLDFQARNSQKNLFLTLSEQGPNAQEVLRFRGLPIRETDALLTSEARVV